MPVLGEGREKKLWKQMDNVVAGLTMINTKLHSRVQYMNMRAKELFDACVKAQMEGDKERAATYASELGQMRKTLNNVIRSQLTLEAVINRLTTVRDFKELRDALAPVTRLVKIVGRDVHGVVPELGLSIRGVQESLEDASMELGYIGETVMPHYESSDSDVKKILEEASEVAARRTKEAVPDIIR